MRNLLVNRSSWFMMLALAVVCMGVAKMATTYAVPVSAAGQPTPEAGKQVFDKRCSGCHNETKAKEGPPLAGVVGRKAGSVPGFPYSDGLKASGITWNETNLQQWLAAPDKMVPDTDMSFSLSNPDERAAVVVYLKSLK